MDADPITAAGGALGVGLGFGLQKVASNLVSGYLLLFDRSIRPGDVINIGDSYGWVQKLAARYIVVRDRNGVDTLIPTRSSSPRRSSTGATATGTSDSSCRCRSATAMTRSRPWKSW